MFCEALKTRVVLVVLPAFLICGGAIVLAQEQSSTFYSTYDARELVKSKKYKGIDFAYGEMGAGMSISEFGADSEKTKSLSYGCRIEQTEDNAFDLAKFLDWLAKETIKQIESSKGVVKRQRHKVGRRFYIEYSENGFIGRIEVDAYVTAENQLTLEVEIIEGSME